MSLKYKSIDVMKLTKDRVNNPLSNENIQKVVDTIKSLGATHVAISVPMDYPDYAKKWATLIHQSGLKILHRGTWNGLEGLYGEEKMVGAKRPPNAAVYWLDKTVKYINDNPELFEDGDLWGPIPEPTGQGIVGSDSTSFLPHEGGPQANFVNFFNQLVDMSTIAFQGLGKAVVCGMTANNFTEIDSGWIFQSFFDKAGVIAVDHYVNPGSLDADLRRVNQKRGKVVFHQEWGTTNADWDINVAIATWKKLAEDGVLNGVNYWGGWSEGIGEGILNDDFTANEKGKLLGDFFKGEPVPEPEPEPEPEPTPEPTPEPEAERIVYAEGLSTIVVVTNKGNLWRYGGSPKVWSKLPLPDFEGGEE